MNRVSSLLIASGLVLCVSTGFAASQTDMNMKWSCTTNASGASTDAEKAADEKMANTVGAAADSYTQAAQNCRDCTKITCEVVD